MTKKKITLNDLRPHASSMELKHPITDELLGVTLKIVGTESAEFKAVFKEQQKKRAALSKEQLEEIEAIEELTTAIQAACVVGWSDDDFFGGAYSKEAIISILKDPEFDWVRLQLNAYVNDRTNFFRK